MRGDPVPPVRRGFHATNRDIVGDRILPPSKHGGEKAFDISSDDDTYFTPIPEGPPGNTGPKTSEEAEGSAWSWLELMPHRGRDRVHVTEPEPEQFVDNNARWSGARTTPSQRIVDTIWAPPPLREGGHVEATLPHINWHQFNAPNWTSHYVDTDPLDNRPNRVRFDSLNNRSVVDADLGGGLGIDEPSESKQEWDRRPSSPTTPGQGQLL